MRGGRGREIPKSRHASRITTLAVSRSNRKRKIAVAFRNVSTGHEPVQILILHEDALWSNEEAGQGDDYRHGVDQNRPNGVADERITGLGKPDTVGQDSIDFLASVSHEVRTPLNSIIGFSELMKDARFGPVDGERFRDYAGDIHASAMHALSLINDLLDITKIIAGKPDLHFEPVNLNEVIEDAVSTMRTQAIRRKVQLKISGQEGLPALYADRRAVKQILLNLVSNAIKFTPEQGEVFVSSRLSNKGGVQLTIEDTGIGMHKDQISTALEPFAQLDSPGTQTSDNSQTFEKGTGLGLPLTKALVKAHNASFSIDSKLERGTRIEILFPPEQLAS